MIFVGLNKNQKSEWFNVTVRSVLGLLVIVYSHIEKIQMSS